MSPPNTVAPTHALVVESLAVEFAQRGWRKRPFRAVDGVSFVIDQGETVGLVGESGSGKSTIGRAILGLTPVAGGRVLFEGRDITSARASERRTISADLQVVFQDPYSSLDPIRTVEQSIAEPLAAQGWSRERSRAAVAELLTRVRLPAASGRNYPAQFSGGQRQRVAIARALGVAPKLVVCDEPISALDLSTQAQVLNLLKSIQDESGIAYLFIAHDLVAVQHLSHRVVVLYRGRVMEAGPGEDICSEPLHPYSRALWAAAPVPDPDLQRRRRSEQRQTTAENRPPTGVARQDGCPFAPRCPHVATVCWTTRPRDIQVHDRVLACHLFDDDVDHPGRVVPVRSAGTRAAGEPHAPSTPVQAPEKENP